MNYSTIAYGNPTLRCAWSESRDARLWTHEFPMTGKYENRYDIRASIAKKSAIDLLQLVWADPLCV